MFIYHITTKNEWALSQASGIYQPSGYASDGFIHASFRDQVIRTANKYYHGIDHLILLQIDTGLVGAEIIEENLEGGEEKFPHIYGTLPVKAVAKSAPLKINPDGFFSFPMQLE
jgi:uncharacterized protein (DUF952 family)